MRPSGTTARGFAASGAAPETFAFQAETRRLLDIVTNSLYTDKEVFVRELVSNASDALEKCRHDFLARGEDPGALEVAIRTDEERGTFSITDTGLGMSKEDLIANLGVIARSGSRAFVEGLDGEDAASDVNAASSAIIGKFGVGFYSAFMVSDRVDVFSSTGDGTAHAWSSAGDGEFTIEQCRVGDGVDEAPSRGTRIVLRVKDSERSLATSAWSVESTLKKYSAFVGFPVTLNGERVNAIDALWTRNEKDVTDEEATAFYRFVSGAGGAVESAPAFRLHFAADAPLTVRALLFAPSENPERGFGGGGAPSESAGVALYSRRVLIQQNARGVLPAFLRFVRGVIDCEDVPLNVSRETPQDSALVRRLGEIVARRVIKWLAEKAKRDPEAYAAWYGKLGVFLKEGICGDESYLYKDSLVPLLRFESSAVRDTMTSLDAYVERMPESQEEVYYLVAPGGRKQAEASPYLEAARARGYEVLFLYAHVDEFVMQHVRKHKGKDLVSAEAATFEAEANDAEKDDAEKDVDDARASAASLSPERMSALCDWFATEALPGRVTGVSTSARLTSTPALLVGHEPEAMRRYRAMLTMMSDEATAAKLDELRNAAALELNPKHAVIKGIERLRREAGENGENGEKARIAKLLAEQVFDNARVAAGALDDPREMVGRIHEILEIALERLDEPEPEPQPRREEAASAKKK